jgi:hypothetical protein
LKKAFEKSDQECLKYKKQQRAEMKASEVMFLMIDIF